MIRNSTLINERLDIFESFTKQNPHLRGRDFKASQCVGDNGSRWDKIDFRSNGNLMTSFADWGLLKVVRLEEETVEIGGTENKEVFMDYNENIYLDIKEVPRNTYVVKTIQRVACTRVIKVKVYRFTTDSNRFNLIQAMGRKIFDSASHTKKY